MPQNHNISSPKRKRPLPPATPSKASSGRLNTSTPDSLLLNEAQAGDSPGTNVAYHLEGLEIEGGGVSRLNLNGLAFLDGTMREDGAPKKRSRTESSEKEIPETPQSTITIPQLDGNFEAATESDSNSHNEVDPNSFKLAKNGTDRFMSGLSRAYPSINRLSDSKSRSRKSADTPPSLLSDDALSTEDEVDFHRAELTWHDDEITGYDPSDSDDDGEGINGIGFKPTAALARVRSERRRQQLADYRNREAKEARAKRSEKRRGSPTLVMHSTEDAESPRKVRFREVQMIDIDSSPTAR